MGYALVPDIARSALLATRNATLECEKQPKLPAIIPLTAPIVAECVAPMGRVS